MSAIETAQRVLDWGRQPLGPPPLGDLQSAEQLANPPKAVCRSLAELWNLTAANLRIIPNSSPEEIGVSGVILAAAAGVSHLGGFAAVLLDCLDVQTSPHDMLTRHSVALPLLRFLPAEMAELFLMHSPLTAVLNGPTKAGRGIAQLALRRLMNRSDFRSAVIRQWVSPGRSTSELEWQASVLEPWRLGDEEERRFVLDVYEAALLLHAEETLERIAKARRAIRDAVATQDDTLLREALAVAKWWGPLWHLERTELDRLRERPYLSYRYHDGLSLYSLARRLTEGTAA